MTQQMIISLFDGDNMPIFGRYDIIARYCQNNSGINKLFITSCNLKSKLLIKISTKEFVKFEKNLINWMETL